MNTGNKATETFVQIVVNELKRSVQRIDDLLNLLPDSKLSRRTKMPSDCGLFILGHLASRLDILLESLSISRQRFHELEEIFVAEYDHDNIKQFSAATLRESWRLIRTIAIFEFSQISSSDWFDYPPDNHRIRELKLHHQFRIVILLSFSHDVANYAGRLARLE